MGKRNKISHKAAWLRRYSNESLNNRLAHIPKLSRLKMQEKEVQTNIKDKINKIPIRLS
jgi:hypothetical protein